MLPKPGHRGHFAKLIQFMVKRARPESFPASARTRLFVSNPFFDSQQLNGPCYLMPFFQSQHYGIIIHDAWLAMSQLTKYKIASVDQLVRNSIEVRYEAFICKAGQTWGAMDFPQQPER